MHCGSNIYEHMQLCLCISFFPQRFQETPSSSKTTGSADAPTCFRDLPFTHIICESEPNSSATPVFNGEHAVAAGRVLHRSEILTKDTLHARKTRVNVTTDSLEEQVDKELVAALEEAIREEVFECSIEAQQRKLKRKYGDPAPEPPKIKNEMAVPVYVHLVEEAGYKDREAPIDHIHTFVVETLRHTNTNTIVPTFLEVQNAYDLFVSRWTRNEFTYGHPGLLLRYEIYITKYVRDRMQASSGNAPLQITAAMVDEVMQQMKIQTAASHVHFPKRNEVEIVMRVKVGSLRRLRRKLLQEYKHGMKEVLSRLIFLETDELASIAFEVCTMNGFEGIVSHQDVQRAAVMAQVSAYREIIDKMHPPVRDFLADKESQWSNDDLDTVMARVKDKYPDCKLSFRRLKVFLWMEKYKAVHGSVDDDSGAESVESDPEDKEG